jgi:putative ABC transport system permease protein
MRYALRSLIKSPAFTAVALMALILGIGTNTIVFSIVDAVLLRPLPYDHPERLLFVSENRRGRQPISVSYADFRDWQSQALSIESMAARRGETFTLLGKDEPEQIEGSEVTSQLFPLLGVRPAVGRTFLPDEDRPGAARVAVLSYSLWQRKFSGRTDVLGQQINLDGEAFTIVGVMPAGFRYPYSHLKGEIYTSLGRLADTMSERAGHPGIYVVGRLKPGVTFDKARSDLDTIARRLQQQYPESNRDIFVEADLLQERMIRGVRPALLVLLAAVGLVLLIACANVANLLLAKALSRRHEIAIRIALGAGRRNLAGQLLSEGLTLSMLGALFGVAFAFAAIRWLGAILPDSIPHVTEVAVNARVLLFTFSISVLTGLVFGLVPLLEAGRRNLTERINSGSRSNTSDARHRHTRSAMVIAEIALSVLLLIGAGLMISSFTRLANTSPGISPADVLAVQLTLPESKYSNPDQRAGFTDQLLARIKGLPGVQFAGAVQPLPLGGSGNQVGIARAGKTVRGVQDVTTADFTRAAPDYFRAIGIPVLSGRSFDEHDRSGAPLVCIIDEHLAQSEFPEQDPIGRVLIMNPLHGAHATLEIVGVVGHVKSYGVDQPSRVELYVPYAQNPGFSMAVMVKSPGGSPALVPAIREELKRIDPNQPISNVVSMDQVVAETTSQQRLSTLLLAAFAATALLLTAIGLYGVVSYWTTERTREFGIRLALGAREADVIELVLRQSAILGGIGVVVGLLAACGLTRMISSLLFGVSPFDPTTFIAAPAILLLVSLVAGVIPARRAMRVDPAIALRGD